MEPGLKPRPHGHHNGGFTMDIVLTPTKLNGTIDARPSLTCVCLHEIAQDLAGAQPGENSPRNRDLSPADAKATPAAPRDFCGQTDLWSPLLEKVRDCFQRLSEPDGMPNCGNDPSALALLLPIASVLKDRVSFIGEKGCPRDILPAAQEALGRFGPSFSCGSLKLRRRDRKKFEEICTLSGRLTYGHISLTGKEDPWFVTGLLFALPLLEGNSTLRMTTLPESTALAEMAVDVLRQYGVTVNFNVDENGYPSFDIPGNQRYRIPGEIHRGRLVPGGLLALLRRPGRQCDRSRTFRRLSPALPADPGQAPRHGRGLRHR